jgi:limonene-1,2-epoxide hydrolase
MSQAEQVVRDFCAAWSRRDVDELLGFFTDDAVYHNMPMEPAQGHEAIRGVFQFFVPTSEEINFEIKHIAAVGDVVLTERVDSFRMNGRDVAVPVAGAFEIRDGKIAAWRDYFDLQTWINQTSG